MWGLPWGFMLLPPLAIVLFRNKGRWLAKDLGVSRRGLLWCIFFLLLGGFVTVSAATFYLNLGGLLALAFSLRLTLRLSAKNRMRALFSAGGAGFFYYAFQTGWFWWLARLPLATDWLLPPLAGALAALLALEIAPAAAGLILGVLGGNTASLLYFSQGLLAVEFGSVACLNSLLLALFFCLLTTKLLERLLHSREENAGAAARRPLKPEARR